MGFFETLGSSLHHIFSFFAEFLSIVRTAITLPLDFIGYIPDLFGTAILICVFVMVVKLIFGR